MFGLFKKKKEDVDDGYSWTVWQSSDVCESCLSAPRFIGGSHTSFCGGVCAICGSREIDTNGVAKFHRKVEWLGSTPYYHTDDYIIHDRSLEPQCRRKHRS